MPTPDAAAALADDALTRVGGLLVLQRGIAYAAAGKVVPVDDPALDDEVFRARVRGTRTYRTEVWIGGGRVRGRCDCPHAAEGWFCKHQVAAALVWRHRLAGDAPPIGDPAATDAESSPRPTPDEDLLAFLRGRDAPTLAAKLMDVARRDRRVGGELRRWQTLTAALEGQDDPRPAITALLRSRGELFGWGACDAYVRQAEAVLPLLRSAASRDPAEALSLATHALRRGWKVLERADDSDGVLGEFLERIGGEWLNALRAAGPRPAAFGETYLQLRVDDPIGCFDPVAADHAIGKAALDRYRDVLAKRWRVAKDAVLAHRTSASKRKRAAARASDEDLALWPLERLHRDQLEAQGLVDDVIAVLREDRSSAHACALLVAFLEEHGRSREAFVEAELAWKAFPDDAALEEAMLRCYERDGWVAEALALHRMRFERAPDVDRFHAVVAAGRAAKCDEPTLRAELMAFVEQRERAPAAVARRGAARDVTLRADILCSEGRWQEAAAVVQPPTRCSPPVLLDIARNLPAEAHDTALALLLGVFEQAMPRATTPYRAELDLVAEIVRRMEPRLRGAWLARLRADYKAKRNFVRGLPNDLAS